MLVGVGAISAFCVVGFLFLWRLLVCGCGLVVVVLQVRVVVFRWGVCGSCVCFGLLGIACGEGGGCGPFGCW